MSLATCLTKFALDLDDEVRLKKLVTSMRSEEGAIKAFAQQTNMEVEGIRQQLIKSGHDVREPFGMQEKVAGELAAAAEQEEDAKSYAKAILAAAQCTIRRGM